MTIWESFCALNERSIKAPLNGPQETLYFGSIVPEDQETLHTLNMITAILKAGNDRKSTSISLVNVSHQSSITDYLMILEGRSKAQMNAIAAAVEDSLDKDMGVKCHSSLGGDWIALDYGEIIVHVMTPELRLFYHLEDLGQEVDVSHLVQPWRSPSEAQDDFQTDLDIDPFWK